MKHSTQTAQYPEAKLEQTIQELNALMEKRDKITDYQQALEMDKKIEEKLKKANNLCDQLMKTNGEKTNGEKKSSKSQIARSK